MLQEPADPGAADLQPDKPAVSGSHSPEQLALAGASGLSALIFKSAFQAQQSGFSLRLGFFVHAMLYSCTFAVSLVCLYMWVCVLSFTKLKTDREAHCSVDCVKSREHRRGVYVATSTWLFARPIIYHHI